MIPRIDMTTAAVDSDYNQIISLFRDTQYTRLPIYEESADNIIGILNIKDIILSQSEETFCIKNIMREPFLHMNIKMSLNYLKKCNVAHIALQ